MKPEYAIPVFLGVSIAICLAIRFFLTFLLWLTKRRPKKDRLARGRFVLDRKQAQAAANRIRPRGDAGFFFGGVQIPSHIPGEHFCIVGAPGSGKTLTIRCLMKSVLPFVGAGYGHRALIYDAKRDTLSMLAGLGLYDPNGESCTVLLNPFDTRSAAWDMARDITDKKTALQVAEILVPAHKEATQPFFTDAARHLLSAVFSTLHETVPYAWTFRDVLLILQDKERLRSLLERSPNTRHLLGAYLEAREWPAIYATIATKVAELEPVAAVWENAAQAISLKDWIDGEGILVLGTDESARSSIDAINRVLLKRITQLLLSVPESRTRRTWIFLDEAQEAGELDGLSTLMLKGRGYGISVVLGFQDIEGWRDVYGSEKAHELVGQCPNKAILRLESSQTAEWASELLGDSESLKEQVSYSERNKAQSFTDQRVTERVMLPAQFMTLATPDFNRGIGVEGVYLVRAIGAYRTHIPPQEIVQHLPPEDRNVQNYDDRSASDQHFEHWSDADDERLGFETAQPQATSSPPPQSAPQRPFRSEPPTESPVVKPGKRNEKTYENRSRTAPNRRALSDVSRIRY